VIVAAPFLDVASELVQICFYCLKPISDGQNGFFGVFAKLIPVFSLYAAPDMDTRRLGIEGPPYAMRKMVTLVARVEGVLQQLLYSLRLRNLV
jgi:hypothetical protein